MILEMKNIRKAFADLEVLKDISMQVDQGEVVSVIRLVEITRKISRRE